MSDEAPAPTLPPSAVPAPRRASPMRWFRFVLMLSLPVALAVAGFWYWASQSRYVNTDNAYLKHDIAQVSADVPGRIVMVAVHDHQVVHAGDLLFSVDPTPYRAKLATAAAAVTTARLHVEELRAAYRQALAAAASAEELAGYERTEYQRQKALLASGTAAKTTYDQALHALNSAEMALDQQKQAVESAKVALAGDPDIKTDAHPEVLAALAAQAAAALDLKHTEMRAPVDGEIGNTTLLAPGYYATPGIATFSLVVSARPTIEANFKETDLTHLRVGQSATLVVDTYPDQPLKGTVLSIGGGTGAEFALLPPQNATGNWVKVVQRVPVRLSVDDIPPDMVLQTGLSATVTVDTGFVPPLAAKYLPMAVAAAPVTDPEVAAK